MNRFAGDLRAAEDRDKWPLGSSQRGAKVLQLLFHQQPGHGRPQMLRDAFGRSVSPMCRPECVVHIEVAKLSQRTRQPRVVAFFASKEASVFEEEHVAR